MKRRPKGRTGELEFDLAILRKAKRLFNRGLREVEALEKQTMKRIASTKEAEVLDAENRQP